MTRGEFNRFCSALTGAENVVQWGGASVWKIGGKVFAIHSDWGDAKGAVVLKPSEMAAEIWRGAEGVAPAPYLGRAGWLQVRPGAMSAAELQDMIRASHGLIAAKLSRAKRAALGV